MDSGTTKSRIGVIDIARFYAMTLVFYGHFVEELMLLKNPAAASQYKFIYSFHIYMSKEVIVGDGERRKRYISFAIIPKRPKDSANTDR